jgi:hypothetical protein
MPQQTTRTRKAKKERKSAEEFIREAADAVANGDVPVKPKRVRIDGKVQELGLTADDLRRERDVKGLSWRQVALNLGLGTPGAARAAYSTLTGQSHHDSVMTGKRAPRGTARKRVDAPGWNDDSDQEEIEARLNGGWIEESGSGATYTPAHWAGSSIVVQHTVPGGTHKFEEEVDVAYVKAFTFGKNGDQPLQITLIEKATSAYRTFFASAILEVR